MNATAKRASDLASTVNAWSQSDAHSFPPLEPGLFARIKNGQVGPADYEALKSAHEKARAQVPAMWPEHVVDVITPQLYGYANDVGALRRAVGECIGVKESSGSTLSSFWTGIRTALLGA